MLIALTFAFSTLPPNATSWSSNQHFKKKKKSLNLFQKKQSLVSCSTTYAILTPVSFCDKTKASLRKQNN